MVPDAPAEHVAAARLTIGQVLAALTPDHPGLTIPKIRFLEDKGLVKPERTASGYRKFSPADVERLRYVLRMQRDHYLPLKVIGEHLEALDRGEEPPAADGQPVPTVPALALARDGTPGPEAFRPGAQQLRVSRKELLKVAEVSEEELAELEAYGLLRASATGHFTADDLAVAATVRALSAYGIEPRHLRGVKAAADREVGLVEQVAAPLRGGRDAAASARAEDAALEVAALAVRLHAVLVKNGLAASGLVRTRGAGRG